MTSSFTIMRQMKILIVVMIVAIDLCFSQNGFLGMLAGSISSNSATVYTNPYYKGQYIQFQGAVKFVGGNWDDKISSMKCQKPCSVITFEDRNFEGRQKSYGSKNTFVGTSMRGKISSLVVVNKDIKTLCYTVYELRDYQGACRRMCGDQDLTGDSFDKKISSFKLECKKCSLILYDLIFLGNFEAFDNNMTFVGDDFNHEIRSIQIRPWKYHGHKDRKGVLPPDTILFKDANYNGRSKIIRGSSVDLGDMDDDTSSIECLEPCSILVYGEKNFKGESVMFQDSQSFMDTANDWISSLRVFNQLFCVTIYEHEDYINGLKQICEDEYFVGSNYNDKISSIRLDCKNCYVEVYKDKEYKGRHATYSTSQSFVGDFNDHISSIRIRPIF